MTVCSKGRADHVAAQGSPACKGHKSEARGGDCCRNRPAKGQEICHFHGGSAPQNLAAGHQKDLEAKAEAALLRKFGDSGVPITDPIGTLCAIAGRAVKLMELIGETLDDDNVDDTRFARYERSLSRAAAIVESLIRMGIADRLAKVDEQLTASLVAFIDGVLSDLGHDPRSPEVAGVVATRLAIVS